ncbi:MAG: aldo/keto reductase [Acidobacteriaceae bacterium]|nr:aldo/keto reductase [Acidobacteriaceae bacterium]
MQTVTHPLAAKFTAPMTTLGFGCAPLMGRASRKESMAALGLAFDAGVTFFDTARSYGYGQSEGLLGDFLSGGRREQVVLCTKFGIRAVRPGWKQQLRPVARAAVRLVPSLRQAVQRRAGDQFTAGCFSVADLEASFDRSLRELKTDYVDMLLLHAAPMSVLEQTDLFVALEKLVQQGKIRAAGISADLPVMETFFAKPIPVLSSAQFALNPGNIAFAEKVRSHADLLLVANHPFGGTLGVNGMKDRVAALAEDAGLPEDLRRKLKETKDPQLFPELVFGMLLNGTGVAAVVPAMVSARNIRANVEAMEGCRFSAQELALVRSALAS